MTQEVLLATLHRHIGQAELEQAFRLLLSWLDADPAYSGLEQRVRGLQSRYSRVREKGIMGLLPPAEVEAELNQVTYALLAVLDSIEKGEATEPPNQPKAPATQPVQTVSWRRWMRWVAASLVLLLLSGLIWYDETKPKNFDLMVVFYGDTAKANVLTNGEVRFLYGGESDTKRPDEDGAVKLRHLDPALRESIMRINPMFPGYSREQVDVVIPEDGAVVEVVLGPG